MPVAPAAEPITLIQAIRQSLDEQLARDERVVLVGQDIGRRGGVFGATQGLLEKYGPQRVLDAPMGAGALAGASLGLALYGFHPICEIQFADFAYPAFGQIINEAAKMHYRSAGAWQVPLVLRIPAGGGNRGGLYHSQSPEAFFAHVPGLKVVYTSTVADARGLLASAVCEPNPVIFLEPKRGYRSIKGEWAAESRPVEIGKAQVSRPGKDLTLVTYGYLRVHALRAAEALAQAGIEVEVIDLRTLLPLDMSTVLASVAKTGRALIVHEDNLTGGLGAELAARLANEAFDVLDAPVRRLAGPDVPAMPFSKPMQDWYMPNAEKIAAAARALVAY